MDRWLMAAGSLESAPIAAAHRRRTCWLGISRQDFARVLVQLGTRR
jgi:hypothetical protein